MFRKTFLGAAFISVFVFASTAHAGKVELTTYYPAPFGEYKTVKLQPKATELASSCTSTQEGQMYYDLAAHIPMVCAGDGIGGFQWSPFGVNKPPLVLGTGNYAPFTLTTSLTNNNWQSLTPASVSGSFIAPIVAGTIYFSFDLSSFPRGFYEVEWGYNVDVTATATARFVGLLLERYGWATIDTVNLVDDDIAVASGSTNTTESRTLQLNLTPTTSQKYRIRARKSNGDITISGVINSIYVKVSKL